LHKLSKSIRFRVTGWASRAVWLLTGVLVASTGFGEQDAIRTEIPSACSPGGYLRVTLYGSLRTTLDWVGPELECSGMPRPNGAGARLHFSTTTDTAGEQRDIDIIIGLPELKPGQAVAETPVNITVMEVDSGRFFSSGEASFCLSDIGKQVAVNDHSDTEYTIQGVSYCVAALPALNGEGSITISDLEFSGQIDWQVAQ